MLFTAMLAALVIDTARERDQRGRANELSGRMGLGRATTRSGPAARLAWAAREFKVHKADLQDARRRLVAASIPVTGSPSATDGLIPWYVRQVQEVVKQTSTGMRGEGIIDDISTLRSIRDWFLGSNPDLGRYSFAGAAWAAEQFHEALASDLAAHAGDSVPPGHIVYSFGDGWTVHAMDNRALDIIQAEGRSMQNCLAEGYYDDDIVSGAMEIYSLRGPPRPDGWSRPAVTMAWSSGRAQIEDASDHKNMLPDFLKANPRYVDIIGSAYVPRDLLDSDDLEDFPEWRDDPPTIIEYHRDHLGSGDEWLDSVDDDVLWQALDDIDDIHEFEVWLSERIDDDTVGFMEIKGRQNKVPAERYRARVMTFIRDFLPRAGASTAALWNYLDEVFPVLSSSDPEFAEFWGNPELSRKLLSRARSGGLGHLGPDEIEAAWALGSPGWSLQERVLFISGALRRPVPDVADGVEEHLLAGLDLLKAGKGISASEALSRYELAETYRIVDPGFSERLAPLLTEYTLHLPRGAEHVEFLGKHREGLRAQILHRLTEAGLLVERHLHLGAPRIGEDPDLINSFLVGSDTMALRASVVAQAGLTEQRAASIAADLGLLTDNPIRSLSVLYAFADPDGAAQIKTARDSAALYRVTAYKFACFIDEAIHPDTLQGVVSGSDIYPRGASRVGEPYGYQASSWGRTGNHYNLEPTEYSRTIPGADSPAIRQRLLETIIAWWRSTAQPDGANTRDPAALFLGDNNQGNVFMRCKMLEQWVNRRDMKQPDDVTRAVFSSADEGLSLWYAFNVDLSPHPLTRDGVCKPGANPRYAADYAVRVDQAEHPQTLAACLAWPGSAQKYVALTGPTPAIVAAVRADVDWDVSSQRRKQGWPMADTYNFGKQECKDAGPPVDLTRPGSIARMLQAVEQLSSEAEYPHLRLTPAELERLGIILRQIAKAITPALEWVRSIGLPEGLLRGHLSADWFKNKISSPALTSWGPWIGSAKRSDLKEICDIGKTGAWTFNLHVKLPVWFSFDRIASTRIAEIGRLVELSRGGGPEEVKWQHRLHFERSEERARRLLQAIESQKGRTPITVEQSRLLYDATRYPRTEAPGFEDRATHAAWRNVIETTSTSFLTAAPFKYPLQEGRELPEGAGAVGHFTSPITAIHEDLAAAVEAMGVSMEVSPLMRIHSALETVREGGGWYNYMAADRLQLVIDSLPRGVNKGHIPQEAYPELLDALERALAAVMAIYPPDDD